MTFYRHIIAIDNLKPCFHRFVVCDAFGIAAAHYSHDIVRQFHLMFLRDYVILYYIDVCGWGYQGYAIERFFGEKYIGYFYDAFLAKSVRVKIVAYCDMGCQVTRFPES